MLGNCHISSLVKLLDKLHKNSKLVGI